MNRNYRQSKQSMIVDFPPLGWVVKLMIYFISIVATSHLSPALAQILGDPKVGYEYAQQVCIECHAIERDDILSTISEARPFTDIANTPGMNERALIVWFRTPHPTMPNFILEIQNEDDVIAYILSLKDD